MLKEKGVDVPEVHVAASSAFDADSIRGTWTLRELVEKSGISKEEFAKGVGFPVDTRGKKPLREIVQPIGKSVENFREIVRKRSNVSKMPGLHAEQIRGYWTLKELILQSGIPKEVFAKKVGFPPNTSGKKKLKDIAHPLGKEVDEFRKVVKEKGQNP